MHLNPTWLVVCLCFLPLIIADPSIVYHSEAKKDPQLVWLLKQSRVTPLITVDAQRFESLVNARERDYTLFIFLTSTTQCPGCTRTHHELTYVASAYQKLRHSKHIPQDIPTTSHNDTVVPIHGQYRKQWETIRKQQRQHIQNKTWDADEISITTTTEETPSKHLIIQHLIFFILLDASTSVSIFQSHRISHVPHLVLRKNTTRIHHKDDDEDDDEDEEETPRYEKFRMLQYKYDIQKEGSDQRRIAYYVQEQTGVQASLSFSKHDKNLIESTWKENQESFKQAQHDEAGQTRWLYLMGTIAILMVIFSMITEGRLDSIKMLVKIPLFWYILGTMFYLFSVCGGMYNIIRSTQLLALGEGGRLLFIHPHSNAQFLGESIVIGIICFVITFSLLSLCNLYMFDMMETGWDHNWTASGACFLIYFFWLQWRAIYTSKNGNYHYGWV